MNIKGFFFKTTLFIVLLLTMVSLCSCILSDYHDTASIVPKDAQVIANINIQSFFKRKAVLGELEKINQEPLVREFLDNLENLAFVIAFSNTPYPDIDLEKELLPYLNTNFSIAFYEVGGWISNLFSVENISQSSMEKFKVPYIIVFDIKDNEGVENFLRKLEDAYHPQKENYKGQVFFSSSASCYFISGDFLVFASNTDLLKHSIDCTGNRHVSLSEDENFISFSKEKMTSDSIGFIYWNMPTLRTEFLNRIPEESSGNWKELLDCIEFMGTSIELDRDKLKFNTYLVHGKTLTPLAKDFFSIPCGKLRSLEFFPQKSSSVLVLGDPAKVLNTALLLFKGIAPEKINNYTGIFTKLFGYSVEEIFSYLAEEISLSFIPKEEAENNSNQNFFSGTWAAAIEIKPDSSLSKTLEKAETVLGFLKKSEDYKETKIMSIPNSSIAFARLNEFLLLGIGEEREQMRSIIDTFHGDEDSIEKRISSQISTNAVGILYLNLLELYGKRFSYFIKNDELKEKLMDTFEKYPEMWGSINTLEDGYSSTLVMPF